MDLRDTYLRLRRKHPHANASAALRSARNHLRLQERIARTGFEWEDDRHYNPTATWSEAGFDLVAKVTADEHGWWEEIGCGNGRFSDTWESGAVRHHRGGSRDCRWFIPLNADYAHQEYERACDYGRGWTYVRLEVVAIRTDIELSRSALHGLESDSGEDYFTETAFELADRAIEEACEAIGRLCRSH
ncbi:hypothetical protein B1C78_00525 [Thioalkalivibrio denitrificans]|uniref:Uncharacterized protein n=1 Tax=Thioalkalivibrio denitrificans TaxID=108003 RepID=A0A1V3NV75_9GAMM|nr:hypothetical protein [Thioalkalivibrio denitrificans]OOG28853.1 hypothetical protein B1C78_00525 [Thioalkalivibrio denitrificans]